MPRTAAYRVIDRPDGLFDIAVRLAPNQTFYRQGLATRAEVDDALVILRDLMAACGAPLIQEPVVEQASTASGLLGATRTGA